MTIEEAFISSGTTVFDLNMPFQVQEQIEEYEGFKIFLPPQDRLAIGIDMAEGGIKGDFSTITARNTEGKVAFQFKAKCSEIILAKKLDSILNYTKDGKQYRGAIIPENNIGLAFINECKNYPWFNFMVKEKKLDSSDDYSDGIIERF